MKKLFLIAVIILSTVSAYAGSSILNPNKPKIDNVLTPDSGSWVGIKYQGIPTRASNDATGHNVNYIEQLATLTLPNGSTRLQVYLSAFAPVAYQAALQDLNSPSGSLSVGAVVFQDSGIIVPKAYYYNTMKKDIGLDYKWNIILSYDIPSSQVSSFKTALSTWVNGKLPKTSVSSNTTFYFK